MSFSLWTAKAATSSITGQFDVVRNALLCQIAAILEATLKSLECTVFYAGLLTAPPFARRQLEIIMWLYKLLITKISRKITLRASLLLAILNILNLTYSINCDAQSPVFNLPNDSQLPIEILNEKFDRLIFNGQFKSLGVYDQDNIYSDINKWSNNAWWLTPQSPSTVSFIDGHVHLITDNNISTNITTLSHDTKIGRLFKFGYFEAQMRWSGRPNANPAFWLFSSEYARGVDKTNYCEIDIFEHFYNNTFTGTAHQWHDRTFNSQNSNNNYKFSNLVDWSKWHNYGMLWTNVGITWFFDEQKLMSTPTPPSCRTQDLFIILSAQKVNPNNQQIPNIQEYTDVNWVRVYGPH